MADRSMEFTGNNDWSQMGQAIDPSDHPAYNMPTATDHHDGTQLGASANDMVMRGRYILEKDRADSTRAAFQGGGYDSTGTFKGTK